jgi:hypothetical protein
MEEEVLETEEEACKMEAEVVEEPSSSTLECLRKEDEWSTRERR